MTLDRIVTLVNPFWASNAVSPMPVTVRLESVLGMVRGPLPVAEKAVMTTPPLPSVVVAYRIFDSWAFTETEKPISSRMTKVIRRKMGSFMKF